MVHNIAIGAQMQEQIQKVVDQRSKNLVVLEVPDPESEEPDLWKAKGEKNKDLKLVFSRSIAGRLKRKEEKPWLCK